MVIYSGFTHLPIDSMVIFHSYVNLPSCFCTRLQCDTSWNAGNTRLWLSVVGLPTKSSITVICRSCGWRQHAFREDLNGISREKIQSMSSSTDLLPGLSRTGHLKLWRSKRWQRTEKVTRWAPLAMAQEVSDCLTSPIGWFIGKKESRSKQSSS